MKKSVCRFFIETLLEKLFQRDRVPLMFPSETGKLLKELGSGDFFGEIGILSLSEGQNR